MLSSDPLTPTPSASSTMMTRDPQSSGTLALLIEMEETPEKNRKGP